MLDTARILIVEDERIVARDVAQRVTRMGHTVVAIAASGVAAIQAASEHAPDLVLMDVGLPGEIDGLAAAAHIWAQLHIPVVYLTGYSNPQTLEQARTPKPLLHLQKPFDDPMLRDILAQALAIQGREPPLDAPSL